MPEPLSPWWAKVHDAAQLLASQLNALVAHAAQVGVYLPPPGSPPPRRRRQPASLRHLAEVIRSHRLAPGVSADKDDVAAVLSGELSHITNPALVVAVARASQLIAGAPFDKVDADRLVVASTRVSALLDAAHQAEEQAPRATPVPRVAASTRLTDAKQPIKQPVVIDAYFTTRRPRRRRAVFAGVLSALLVVAAAVMLVFRDREPDQQLSAVTSTAAAVAAVTPLEHGHAYDDYLNPRPLQDALDRGFTSVEADVFLRDGTLMVCYLFEGNVCKDDRNIRTTAKPFTPTYLQALNARVSAGGGRVYPGFNQPFLLFVDIKCEEAAANRCKVPEDPAAAATDQNNPLTVARKVIGALDSYHSMLFHHDATARRWGPVQVVLTGDHTGERFPVGADGYSSVRDLLAQQNDKYAFLDGTFAVDKNQYNADLVPVISFPNPVTGDGCTDNGEQPIQKSHWDHIIEAQSTGHHVRVVDPRNCPDNSELWTDALYGGVDYISSRHLSLLGDWLAVNAVGGGGGNCAVPAWVATAQLNGQDCNLAKGNVPVLSRPDPTSSRVGVIATGGAHWFAGQQPGEPYSLNADHNFWWAYTRADNGQWGWVSVLYFTDPGPDQSADGLQYACYDVRPGEDNSCHPI